MGKKTMKQVANRVNISEKQKTNEKRIVKGENISIAMLINCLHQQLVKNNYYN